MGQTSKSLNVERLKVDKWGKSIINKPKIKQSEFATQQT